MTSATASKTKTVLEGVAKEIVEVLGLVEPIRIEATSTLVVDFGADSLDSVELAMALEDHFDIEVPDEEWEGVLTVAQVVAVVHKHLKSQGREMPLGVDLGGQEKSEPGKSTDWQVGHVENGGKTFVIYDMALPDEDAGACTVSVKGRGAKEVADKLAAFLQSEGL